MVSPIIPKMKRHLEEASPNVLELWVPMKPIDWKLCLVADTKAAGTRDLVSIIEDAVRAGTTLIQLRGKNCETRELLELAFRISEVLDAKKVPFLINDRVDIALACGADGVHLGQKDMPLIHARRLLGRERSIGISVNTIEEALAAERDGADYIGAGPVYFTSSKDKIPAVLGLEGIRTIREKVRIPILAIGGITRQNARAVISAGADGIAVISAIMGEEDPIEATKGLISILS